ncbi:T9SS type A sorting domain-containing protein [Ignavibacterium album]|uniref:T9SS type A sorting domain-containing protein n=1 Tax=Ignavibacterium album TaxID=591197 RepID=UPI001FCC8E23|nr:T9SS type A sorting domain-containing protein [Ignavibacterium album]
MYDFNNNVYWIGCGWEFSGNDTIRGGLAKFDGINWMIFNSSNSPIQNDAVTHLAIDNQNRILIASYGEGFYRYNGSNWEIFNSLNSPLPSNDIQYISIDKNNNIWLAIFGFGAVKFDGSNWLFYNYNNSFNGIEDLNFIESDNTNIIWFGSEYNGLYSFDGTLFNRRGEGPLLDSISMTSFALDSSGNPWFTGNILFAGNGILSHFTNQSWFNYNIASYEYNTRFSYNTLTIDRNNNKFIGSAIGLFKFDDNFWTLFSTENSPIPFNIFTTGITDSKNNKIYGLRAPTNFHPTGYVGLIFFNEDSVVITSVEENISQLNNYELNQNYPNPFNPTTTIEYAIPNGSRNLVTLKVYDLLGNEVTTLVNEYKEAGRYKVEFNATDLPSGIYFYKLQVASFTSVKKMILLK